MTIALIAHDSKKELMVQFCTAYCRILSQHKLVATGTTGKLISEATGLQVQRFLAGVQGGDQQIASRIACNEIDLLLFFRDPINAKPSEPNEMTLLRLCDVHNIPMATNIATAEVLIHGLVLADILLHGGNGGREFRLGYGGLQDAGGAVRGRGRADDALFRLRPADEAARGGVRRHDRRIRAGGVLFQADFLF